MLLYNGYVLVEHKLNLKLPFSSAMKLESSICELYL